MRQIVVVLLSLVLLPIGMQAQEVLPPPEVVVFEEPRPDTGDDVAVPSENESQARRLAAQSVIDVPSGSESHGDIYFNDPTYGIFMKSKVGWPGMRAQLGTADNTASWSVVNSAGSTLFSARADGLVSIGGALGGSQLTVASTTTGRYGVIGYASTSLAANADPVEIGGYFYNYQNIASGVTSNGSAYGVLGRSRLTGSGALLSSFGLYADAGINPAATGTVTSAFGLRSMVSQGGGSIANGYGLYIDDVTATNDWAIFSAGGNDTSYFAGTVSIGSTTPPSWGRLTVVGAQRAGGAAYIATSSPVTQNESFYETAAVITAYQRIDSGVRNGGLGTGARATSWLQGQGTLAGARGLVAEALVYPDPANTGTIESASAIVTNVANNTGVILKGHGIYINDVKANEGFGVYQAGSDDRNFFAGSVTVGQATLPARLDVVGDAHFTGTVTGGNIRAKFQDLAEWVPSSADLEPGTVVVLNKAARNEVMASNASYDTSVAGVVSMQPGISLGEEGEGKEQIATTGRVLVRVDARNGAIGVGDLLVTSEVPGTAMKSQPMTINGRSFHQPGTIIGKALEPLEGGVGEILVLLSLQ